MTGSDARPVTVVLGATGHVGRGVVPALLRSGHHVVAVTHDRARPTAPAWGAAGGGTVTTVAGSLEDEARADALFRSVQAATGGIDNVVAALPGWYWGRRLLETPVDELEEAVGRIVRLHVVAARTFLPRLPGPGGQYLLVNSPAATTTVPELGAMSIAAAAELMLGRALGVEQPSDGARVTVLQVTTPVLTTDAPGSDLSMRTAEEIGEQVAWLLAQPSRRRPVVRWPYAEARPYDTAEHLVTALSWAAEARDERHAWAGHRPADALR
ncbi:SDR family oxidoreductase [Geodermatophilus sp. SYSU D00710]